MIDFDNHANLALCIRAAFSTDKTITVDIAAGVAEIMHKMTPSTEQS